MRTADFKMPFHIGYKAESRRAVDEPYWKNNAKLVKQPKYRKAFEQFIKIATENPQMKTTKKTKTPKRTEVMCSCGRFFTTPQKLWDHFIAEEDKVVAEVKAKNKRKL